MKIFDDKLKQDLYAKANTSERKRSHHLLHESHCDYVQRFLVAFAKGCEVSPHYHEKPHQWEMITVLEGTLKFKVHDKNLDVIEEFLVGPSNSVVLIELPPNKIHSIECLSDFALMLEVKEGPFDEKFAAVIW